MKKMRFIVIATIVALVLGSFAVVPGTAKAVAGTAQGTAQGTAAIIPDFSPFLLAAGSPVITAIGVESGLNAPAYACQLVGQTPKDWTTFKKRTIFDTYWTIKNTGTKVWGIHGVDVAYRGGTRMHTSSSFYDLPKQVGQGQKIVLSADMIAPKQPGYYVSNWGLYLGSQIFCGFYLVIYVSG